MSKLTSDKTFASRAVQAGLDRGKVSGPVGSRPAHRDVTSFAVHLPKDEWEAIDLEAAVSGEGERQPHINLVTIKQEAGKSAAYVSVWKETK